MKKAFLFLLFSSCFLLNAQKDSTHHFFKVTDNRYGPFHRTIKDTTTKTVSKFGHYFSFGTGYENNFKYSGVTFFSHTKGSVYNRQGYQAVSLYSYSLAYKSHLVTVTGGFNGFGGYNTSVAGYQSNYIGCLVGESVRFKHLMVSLSAGIASTNIILVDPTLYKFAVSDEVVYEKDRCISFPIELKAFLLARNGIGIGIHVSENVVSQVKYSPFLACVCLVAGIWNKPKIRSKLLS